MLKHILWTLIGICLLWSCAPHSGSTTEEVRDSVGDTSKVPGNVPEETEAEEMERLQSEEQHVFDDLGAYDGMYNLYTESENAEGTLQMKYLGDRTFKFVLRLSVDDLCEGIVQDTAFVDRTQHALFATDHCLLHFNLLGENIEIVEPDGCDQMEGDCTFSGVYEYVMP
jgi:hypothetical protein